VISIDDLEEGGFPSVFQQDVGMLLSSVKAKAVLRSERGFSGLHQILICSAAGFLP